MAITRTAMDTVRDALLVELGRELGCTITTRRLVHVYATQVSVRVDLPSQRFRISDHLLEDAKHPLDIVMEQIHHAAAKARVGMLRGCSRAHFYDVIGECLSMRDDGDDVAKSLGLRLIERTIEAIAEWVQGDGADAQRVALADGIREGRHTLTGSKSDG